MVLNIGKGEIEKISETNAETAVQPKILNNNVSFGNNASPKLQIRKRINELNQ